MIVASSLVPLVSSKCELDRRGLPSQDDMPVPGFLIGSKETARPPPDQSSASLEVPSPALTSAVPPPPPLRAVHTSNFPALLDQLGVSLLVPTYQAGKFVVLRADQDHVNAHFRDFNKPMGLAVAGDRLAVGTALEIWEYHNVPAVAPKMEPPGRHDACYLPRT